MQLKASEAEANPNSVAIQLEVPTLLLLREMLEVAMLVKYIAHEREAYWILLKEFTAQPRVGQKTITVRIPKANRLSGCPWEQVAEHVQAVLASSAFAGSPTHYHSCSAAPLPWRSAFSWAAHVFKAGRSLLAFGSNSAVKRTRILRAAYLGR